MKNIVHHSVIPIYVSAIIWGLASLFLPMYRLWHYLLYLALAVAGFFIARHFCPDTVEQVEAPPDSGDPQVDQLILSARAQQDTLRRLGTQAVDPQVTASAVRLDELCGKILSALETDPQRLGRTKKFLSYYLPTTVTLLRRYLELEKQQLHGENITSSMEKIRNMLQTVESAFQAQLDHLYEADAMDISADIAVMQKIMASEGLMDGTGPDSGLSAD